MAERGRGSLALLETIFCRSLTLCIFKTYKIAGPPQTTRERRGPQTVKHMPQSLLASKFFKMTTFALVSI
jgi:hypothetical protein